MKISRAIAVHALPIPNFSRIVSILAQIVTPEGSPQFANLVDFTLQDGSTIHDLESRALVD